MAQNSEERTVKPLFRIEGEEQPLQLDSARPVEEVCLEREKLMMAILDSINDGVFTIDFNMKITSFNRGAERITGYSAQEAIGMLCMDIFCNSSGIKADCIAECPMKKTMKYREPITKKLVINKKNGEILTVSSTTNILLDLQNRPIGGVETFIDITAFERLKEKWQDKKYSMGHIVGKSPKMAEVYQLIESISDSLANVLIQGETGTGKGVIARAIHFRSVRHRGPFVQINCAAIPETLLESELFGHVKGAFTGAISERQGRFEQAHKGTLFLDEIGELSPAMQAKLLRVVEEKQLERVGGSRTIKVDVRIISATNKDLKKASQDERFREDLYFRLNTIPITLAPLRERMEDITLLVEHFIEKFNYKMDKKIRGAAAEIFDIFLGHAWPGNVRELESVLEYAFTLCQGSNLEVQHLPPHFKTLTLQGEDNSLSNPTASDVKESSGIVRTGPKTVELAGILTALEACRWNREEAAKRLNLSRTTLWRIMKKYQLINR